MAAAERRMHELKNIKVGATLVIRKDGLNWFSGDKITRREVEPRWLMSSGETVQTEEEDQARCSCFLLSSHHGSQKKPIQESVIAFPDPVLPESPETQKGHLLSVKNISSVIPNNLNVSNQQNSMNKTIINGCIILCDDWELFQDWRKFTGHQRTMDNMFVSTLKPSIIQKSLSPITEDAANGNLINLRSHLQICPNSNDPDESAEQDGNVKRKKSVSFDEDVTVYLFDQETPTVELHPESDPFLLCSCFHHMQTVEEDSGWEWEDDFQALENTPYFQTAMDPHSVSLSSLDWTSPSRLKNRSLSHTCLVLTYVTESDLEL